MLHLEDGSAHRLLAPALAKCLVAHFYHVRLVARRVIALHLELPHVVAQVDRLQLLGVEVLAEGVLLWAGQHGLGQARHEGGRREGGLLRLRERHRYAHSRVSAHLFGVVRGVQRLIEAVQRQLLLQVGVDALVDLREGVGERLQEALHEGVCALGCLLLQVDLLLWLQHG